MQQTGTSLQTYLLWNEKWKYHLGPGYRTSPKRNKDKVLFLHVQYHWRDYETYDLNIKASALIFHDFQLEELLNFSRMFSFPKDACGFQRCHVNLHPNLLGGDDVELFASLVPHVWNRFCFWKTYQLPSSLWSTCPADHPHSWHLKGIKNCWHDKKWPLNDTVDGRNPAPVGMVNISLFTGFSTCWVVQDFFHQQYQYPEIEWGSVSLALKTQICSFVGSQISGPESTRSRG